MELAGRWQAPQSHLSSFRTTVPVFCFTHCGLHASVAFNFLSLLSQGWARISVQIPTETKARVLLFTVRPVCPQELREFSETTRITARIPQTNYSNKHFVSSVWSFGCLSEVSRSFNMARVLWDNNQSHRAIANTLKKTQMSYSGACPSARLLKPLMCSWIFQRIIHFRL